jgi:hypothetical protein
MVNLDTIQTSFDGLVGWRQPANPTYAIIDAENLTASSNQYFQDISGLVTIENIKELQNYVDISDSEFNDKLREITNGALLKLMNSLFYQDDFIENRLLYNYEYDYNHPIDNNTDFVGYEIEVCNSKELTSTINRIFATFNAVDTVKVLLFHSSKKDPIQTWDISTEQDNEVVLEVDQNIPFTNGISGGKYYIGYLTSGLTAKAYDRQFESANNRTCFNLSYWNPIKVTGHDSETLFDVNDISNVSQTWGLNFDVSGFKEYTSIVTNNKNRFINAYMLQVAADVLDMFIASTRSNLTERINKANVAIELNGNIGGDSALPNIVGIIPRLTKAKEDLREQIIQPLISKGTLS